MPTYIKTHTLALTHTHTNKNTNTNTDTKIHTQTHTDTHTPHVVQKPSYIAEPATTQISMYRVGNTTAHQYRHNNNQTMYSYQQHKSLPTTYRQIQIHTTYTHTYTHKITLTHHTYKHAYTHTHTRTDTNTHTPYR